LFRRVIERNHASALQKPALAPFWVLSSGNDILRAVYMAVSTAAGRTSTQAWHPYQSANDDAV